MITPQKILDLSEPAEELYQHIVDELLVNIGRHLRGNTTTWTAYWEIQKLQEMGQLTAENAAIINRWVAEMPDVLKDTMEETRKYALSQIEAQMKAAVASGHLTEPIQDSSVARMRDYLSQAADKLNATNTTMLQSSLEAYQSAVLETSQKIMAEEAAQLATGTKAREQIMRETITRLSDAGLTGFYDRAGRAWTPEAYVNMVMRTTVHNTAIASTRARMEDYGTDVFQVSSHAGARPGCYPYQGKFYSWGGSSGEIELGNGKIVNYAPISDTTYGEPAGLFGINCGHSPIPIIPGVTIPHGDDNIQPEEANKKEYAESQQQRQLEREIREKKRVLEMLGNTATDADKAALKDAQAKMRAFTEATGRARRYDREKIYGGGKTTAKKTATKTEQPYVSKFTPAASIADAEKAMARYVDSHRFGAIGVSYEGVSLDVANRVNKTVIDFFERFHVSEKLGGIAAPAGNTKLGQKVQGATAAYSPVRNSILLNRKSLKDAKTADKAFQAEKDALQSVLEHPERYDLTKLTSRLRGVIERSKISGRATVPENVEEALTHELGHMLEDKIKTSAKWETAADNMGVYADKVSGYAGTDISEYIAESVTSYLKGEKLIDPLFVEILEEIENG